MLVEGRTHSYARPNCGRAALQRRVQDDREGHDFSRAAKAAASDGALAPEVDLIGPGLCSGLAFWFTMQVMLGPKQMTEHDDGNKQAYYEAAAALRERQIQDKERKRKHLAALSFTEKIEILEKLRDREKALAACGLRKVERKPSNTSSERSTQ
jgi:hypothetical protein